jgi:hypothetical protein
MRLQVCLVNVGVNSEDKRRGLMSPLFDNGEFEFVPIAEDPPFAKCELIRTYEEMHSFSQNQFSEFVPERMLTSKVHNDPEFENFTFGDYPSANLTL